MEAFLSIIVLFIIVVYFISKSSKYVGYGRKRRFYKNKWNNQYNKQSKVEISLEYMADGRIRVKRIMNKEENQIYYTILKIFKNVCKSENNDLFEWMKRGYKEMASINLGYAEEAVTAEFYDELEYERWLCGV